jgi:hypothetical protein
MKRYPGPADQWYVGTAVAARTQMFIVHGFKNGDVGLYRQAASESDAASLAAHLIKRGAKGDGAVKPGAVSIYVFKRSSHSKPAL